MTIDKAALAAIDAQEAEAGARLTPVGFWRNDWDPATKDLPDPRKLVDPGWPFRERVRVASYLRRGRRLVAYAGYSMCRFDCGTPWHFMGKWDLGDERYVWPEGFAHYVEFHSVRPPSDFLAHIRPRLPRLWPWWRLAAWIRRARFRLRVVLAAWDARRQRAKKKQTPLHAAADENDLDAVVRLLREGADPNAADEYKLTPLARARGFEVARELIAAGAAIDPRPPGYITPLQQATTAGDVRWCRDLLDRGADVDGVDACGRTPLERASAPEVIELLLERGADPSRGSPLFWPANAGDLERIDALLAAGARVDAPVRDFTPLMAAARSAQGDRAIDRLLEAGAAVDARSELGETPLILAASRNGLWAVQRLLDAGASASVFTQRKVGPLHMSALGNRGRDQSTAVLETLIAAGAGPIDARDQWGRTALRIAAQYGSAADARVLLDAGADPSLPDANGVTAVVAASQRNLPDLVTSLRRARRDGDAASSPPAPGDDQREPPCAR